MGNYYRFNPNGYLQCPSDIIFSDNPEIVDAVLSAEGVKNVKDMSGRYVEDHCNASSRMSISNNEKMNQMVTSLFVNCEMFV